MTNKQIKAELRSVLKEMDNWHAPKGPLPPDEVRRRELILWSQGVLYGIEDAKKKRDKVKEAFHTVIFCLIKSFLGSKGKDNKLEQRNL